MKKLLPLTMLLALALAAPTGCDSGPRGTVVTISASRVGAEGKILRQQMARFQQENPDIHIEFQDTPDASDLRHQLYAQYLNARTGDPDVLQLDVIWTPEFAGAGWIMRLDDRFDIDTEDFFPVTIKANQWQGGLYGLPWFADVGMLYYRTDLIDAAPETFDELTQQAKAAKRAHNLDYGFLWQGARYEGLVCVFLEHLGGFGGRIMDERGRIVVDSEEAVQALTYMRDSIYRYRIVPEVALQWQEEDTLQQFKLGNSAFLRSWPYAARELSDEEKSEVVGKFAVTAMPAAPRGSHTATLGGSQLAINVNTEHPEAAFKVIAYLTHPDRMLERAKMTGQFPTRKSVYDRPALADALRLIPPTTARRLIEQARTRPVTPVYMELSDILQDWLHRALLPGADISPRDALQNAAREMKALLHKYELYEE